MCPEIKQSDTLPSVPRIQLPGGLEHNRSKIRLRRGGPVHFDVRGAQWEFCNDLCIQLPPD